MKKKRKRKDEIGDSRMIVGDCNGPLSEIDRIPRQKINKGIEHQAILLDMECSTQ